MESLVERKQRYMPEERRHGHAAGRVCNGSIVLSVFICLLKARILEEDINRIFISLPGVFFNTLRHMDQDYSLVSFTFQRM